MKKMYPGIVAYYAHWTRIWRTKGYDLCVLTSGLTWQILYSFTLPPNRNTIPNACRAHRIKELFTKWIFTACLKVFRAHHTLNHPFILWMNVFLSPEAVSAIFGLETLNELHGNGSPGNKLSLAGSTDDSTVAPWVNATGQTNPCSPHSP